MSGNLPTNLRRRDHDAAVIGAAIEYALSVVTAFESWMRTYGPDERRAATRPFEGLDLLEVGPGETVGSSALLACAGARVSAADRFETRWDPGYHAPFFEALLGAVVTHRPHFDPAPIKRLLTAQGFVPEVVDYRPYASEDLRRFGTGFDVVLSNAVLEHVHDLHVTAANLATVTKAGGCGFHQVDLRDHRDFTRPLEYLTVSRADYENVREQTFCERGCQWRLSTIGAALEAAGFAQQSFPNMFAEDAYLADLRPRLHDEFAAMADDDLKVLSALYVVRRDR